jgi:hypothetical protein
MRGAPVSYRRSRTTRGFVPIPRLDHEPRPERSNTVAVPAPPCPPDAPSLRSATGDWHTPWRSSPMPGVEGHRDKKPVRPAARREAVGHPRGVYRMAERRACRVIAARRTTMRYRSQARGRSPLRERIRELAAVRVRCGGRRIHISMRMADIPSQLMRPSAGHAQMGDRPERDGMPPEKCFLGTDVRDCREYGGGERSEGEGGRERDDRAPREVQGVAPAREYRGDETVQTGCVRPTQARMLPRRRAGPRRDPCGGPSRYAESPPARETVAAG